jgi:DtxR family Mn-dependent transcriptional regulator
MSESLEMYLITVAQLGEELGTYPVPLSHVAKALNVLPVSAHQMIRKLVEEGLVLYTPYKGVDLTSEGRKRAMRILRRRRLWQVFLVEKLGLTPADASAFSCRLEHITPDDVTDRLDDYLGHPAVSPLGKPIPGPQDVWQEPLPRRLSSLEVGESARIVRVDADPSSRVFLSGQGLRPGEEILMLAVSESGDCLVQVGGKRIALSGEIADGVAVEPAPLEGESAP